MFSCVPEACRRGLVPTFGVLLRAACSATHITPPSASSRRHPTATSSTLGQARGRPQAELRGLVIPSVSGGREGLSPQCCGRQDVPIRLEPEGLPGNGATGSAQTPPQRSQGKRQPPGAHVGDWGPQTWPKDADVDAPESLKGLEGDWETQTPVPFPPPSSSPLSHPPLPPAPASSEPSAWQGQSAGPRGYVSGHTGRMRAAGPPGCTPGCTCHLQGHCGGGWDYDGLRH